MLNPAQLLPQNIICSATVLLLLLLPCYWHCRLLLLLLLQEYGAGTAIVPPICPCWCYCC
jgi:hypothetical protein